MKRRRYIKEIKQEVAKLVVEQGYTQADACKSLGISNKNIGRWIKDLNGESSSKKTTKSERDLELSRLKKENAQLKLER